MIANRPQHSARFRVRRVANWLPMGLAYAFLYMGRDNLTVAKNALAEQMPKDDFGLIFGVGAVVYGVSFLINGPLIDRVGGRRGFLIGIAGALVANVLMGLVLYGSVRLGWQLPLTPTFLVLYSINMYFQSYGAVSIVTVKAPWFHVRERGTFSTIFGVLIAAGTYFAFDWGQAVVDASRATPHDSLSFFGQVFQALFGLGGSGVNENWMVFFVPATFLALFWVILFLFLRNTPAEAGFQDFATGEETLSAGGERLPVFKAVRKILTHPVLLIVCLVELCSGVLRNGTMHWYNIFAKEVGFRDTFFITDNWGLMLLIAGVVGAQLTGMMSDKIFGSRRAPMAGVLYGLMVAAALVLTFSLSADPWWSGISALAILMSVIGIHGILSGTATVDFGGAKNTGIVVGIVDGFVYLGSGLQALVVGQLVPDGPAAKVASNWIGWPLFLLPFAVAGLVLTIRIWNSLPDPSKRHH